MEIRYRRWRELAAAAGGVLLAALGAVLYLLYRRSGRANAALRDLNGQLEYHAAHDALTGLRNRRSFAARMKQRDNGAVERRGAGTDVDCLILLDIDHFKAVNDSYGHGAGDAVLKEVARRLQGAVRDSDMALRWGGEG